MNQIDDPDYLRRMMTHWMGMADARMEQIRCMQQGIKSTNRGLKRSMNRAASRKREMDRVHNILDAAGIQREVKVENRRRALSLSERVELLAELAELNKPAMAEPQ